MKKLFGLSCVLLLCISLGCSNTNPKQVSSPKAITVQSPDSDISLSNSTESELDSRGLQSANIIDIDRLKSGGNLLIKAFRAGAEVESDEELEKVALRIIRGMSDQLKGNRPYFNIFLNEDAGRADFIMDGYITHKSEPSMMKKLTFRKNSKQLDVEGKIIDRNTGKVLFVFSDSVVAQKKEDEYTVLGELVGSNIGQYLYNELK